MIVHSLPISCPSPPPSPSISLDNKSLYFELNDSASECEPEQSNQTQQEPEKFFELSCLSQNIMKSNTLQHALLNNSLKTHRTDVLFIQEPWYGYIGVDYEHQSSEIKTEKFRVVNNPQWIQILPMPNCKVDVVTYVRKSHHGWNITYRADLISHPSIMAVQFMAGTHQFLVINLYNPSDNSVVEALKTIKLPQIPILITGDFNLHHPMWSTEISETNPETLGGQGDTKADQMIDWMHKNNFTLMNKPGETTFFRQNYSSVLDLTWISDKAIDKITDWGIREDLHFGADHLPITWKMKLHSNNNPIILPTFKVDEEKYDKWSETFLNYLNRHWTWNEEVIHDKETFLISVQHFHDALIHASKKHFTPKPPSPKAAKWFNRECKTSLGIVRDARRTMKNNPNPQNIAIYHAKNNQFKRTIKKAKKLGAMEITANTPHLNIWKLTNWYKGI